MQNESFLTCVFEVKKKTHIEKTVQVQDAEKEKEEDEKYAKKVEILYAFIRAVVSLSFSFIRIKKVCVCLCDSSFQRRSWSTSVLPRLRQSQRILRPLVLGTLFRASSFRTRGARRNECKRLISSR